MQKNFGEGGTARERGVCMRQGWVQVVDYSQAQHIVRKICGGVDEYAEDETH
jgi:hypothetical protein